MAEAAKPRSILLAVPTTGGLMKAKTAESLFRLLKALGRADIECDLVNINNSDIVTVRNIYANMLLDSDRWDALLFIDSDMAFTPRVVMKLIGINALVSAAACTKRHIDLDKFAAAIREHGDVDRAKAESVFFNPMLSWDNRKSNRIRRRSGFATAAAIGMAVCLIRKQALELMIEEGAVQKRQDVYEGKVKESWGFFDMMLYRKMTLTEDYSFCHRWTYVMERLLWVCTDEIVEHIGDFGYSGRYDLMLDKLLSKPEEAEPEASAA